MSCYIASNDNRLYAGLEESYGQAPAITAANRFPAVRLTARQARDLARRYDKTGGRSFRGVPTGTRRRTNFELKTYLTGWNDAAAEPGYGPLFRSAMGAAPLDYSGGTVQASENGTRIRFSGSHGLVVGQGVTIGTKCALSVP